VGLSFVAEGLFPRKGIDMWIRGTVRLIMVALLGTEITIIALASAASAATQPGQRPATGGRHEPVPLRHAADMGGFADVLGPEMAGAWGHRGLQAPGMAGEALAGEDWFLHDQAWPRKDAKRPQERRGPQSAAEARERTEAAQRRPEDQAAHPAQPAQEAQATHEVDGAQAAQPAERAERAERIEQAEQAERAEHAERAERTERTERAEQAKPAQESAAAQRAEKAAAAQPARVSRPASAAEGARAAKPEEPRRTRAVTGDRALKIRNLLKNVDLSRVKLRQSAARLSHVTANRWLKGAGLRTRSTGNCTSRYVHRCTSLDNVRTGTVARIIQLKRESGCPITVTGGTEVGHAPGPYSHGNGYKLDISHNP
jgi:hypothetical protein